MQTEKTIIKEPQTKVEVQVLPCAAKSIPDHEAARPMNHESQDDPCIGSILLTVTSEGSKLTKADAGRLVEFTEEVFVTAKITPTESNKLPNVEISVSEKCGAKLTKADAGIVQ